MMLPLASLYRYVFQVEWLPTESAGQAECGNLAASSLTTSTDAAMFGLFIFISIVLCCVVKA